MKTLHTRLAAGLLAGGLIGTAAAEPTSPATIGSSNLLAGGTSVGAAFLFADAADTNLLYDVTIGETLLFNNQTSPQGSQVTIGGLTPGQTLSFRLDDITTGGSFTTGTGSTNVAYLQTQSAADIAAGLGITLSGAGLSAFEALAAQGPVAVIGFEDRPLAGSDRDYNDLLFAFSPVTVRTTDPGGGAVPEPAPLALLALGGVLLGVGRARRGSAAGPSTR